MPKPDRGRPPDTDRVPKSIWVPDWGWLPTRNICISVWHSTRQIYQVSDSTRSSTAIGFRTLTSHCSNNHPDLFSKAIAYGRKTNASYIGLTFRYQLFIPHHLFRCTRRDAICCRFPDNIRRATHMHSNNMHTRAYGHVETPPRLSY